MDCERPLRSKPLRQLTSDDLAGFVMSSMLTWGDENDLRHFLPRILELTAIGESLEFDREVALSKLNYAEWRYWPQTEQIALGTFFMTTWRAALSVPPEDDVYNGDAVESWLCALAQAGGPLAAFLNEWLVISSRTAIHQLAVTITRTRLIHQPPKGINAYWQGHHDQAEEVSAWLRSDAVRKKLERAAEMFANEAVAEELMAAIRMVS